MPDDVLNLNLGQVQAVIEGYSERILDHTIQSVWTGYYSAYFFGSKHPKKPTEIIKTLISSAHEAHKQKHANKDADMQAEIEKFAQRDLHFLQAKGGKP